MATLQEIVNATRKAHEAGNTAHAKQLTKLYFRELEKQKKQSKTTYQRFQNAETQGLEGVDAFIRTKANLVPGGSTAFGPVQITGTLVQDMKNKKVIPKELMDYTNRFLEQAEKFKKYGNNKDKNLEGYDPKYDYGGSGDLTSEQDMKDYKSLADVIIKHHEDKSDGDELKLINSWRFGPNSDKSVETEDKDYLERYRDNGNK
tara:strand:+ start:1754 stop:2362 length:609 start_codon:yes stop_codon:yes gene_type:complete